MIFNLYFTKKKLYNKYKKNKIAKYSSWTWIKLSKYKIWVKKKEKTLVFLHNVGGYIRKLYILCREFYVGHKKKNYLRKYCNYVYGTKWYTKVLQKY